MGLPLPPYRLVDFLRRVLGRRPYRLRRGKRIHRPPTVALDMRRRDVHTALHL